MPPLAQPESYIANADTLFDGNGQLTDLQTRRFRAQLIGAFESHIANDIAPPFVVAA